MECERREGEVVHHLGFIGAARLRERCAEVTDVIFMRHIRLGDQQDAGRHGVENCPPQLHNRVRLRQVDARRAGRLPQIGNRVEANDLRALGDVMQQYIRHLQEHLGIGIVEVDLVCAEGGPDVAQAIGRLHGCQQGQRARPHDLREIQGGIDGDEVVAIRCLPASKPRKPLAVLGDMVGNEIKHQAIVLAQNGDIIPIPEIWINLQIVDHRKTIVR